MKEKNTITKHLIQELNDACPAASEVNEPAYKGTHTLKALKVSEKIFKTIFEHALDGIVLADNVSRKFLLGNRQIYKDLAYSPDEFRNLGVEDIHPEKDLPHILDLFEKLIRNEIVMSRDTPMKRKDGSIYYADISALPISLGDKSLTIGIFRDVTERKLTEEALRSSESFLNSIIDLSPHPMWISDRNGTLQRINQACTSLLHISEEEVIGKYNVLTDNIIKSQGLLPLVRSVFEEGKIARFELAYDTSQLENLPLERHSSLILEVTIFPIRNAQGMITHAVIQHINITERKQAEEELRKHRDHLEDLVRASTADLARACEQLKQENELRKMTEDTLRSRDAELEKKQKDLEEMNAALRVLLKQRDMDKATIETNITKNIKTSVLPYVEKLKASGLREGQDAYLSEIELHLNEITSSFIKELSSEYIGLSPCEMQVALLIKEGRASKEISEIMNVSLNTVLYHRYHIRKKTGLNGRKINLRAYLDTLKNKGS